MSRHRPKSFFRHMTPEKAAEIRRQYFAGGITQVELARQYNLAQGSISRIVSGHVWSRPAPRNKQPQRRSL